MNFFLFLCILIKIRRNLGIKSSKYRKKMRTKMGRRWVGLSSCWWSLNPRLPRRNVLPINMDGDHALLFWLVLPMFSSHIPGKLIKILTWMAAIRSYQGCYDENKRFHQRPGTFHYCRVFFDNIFVNNKVYNLAVSASKTKELPDYPNCCISQQEEGIKTHQTSSSEISSNNIRQMWFCSARKRDTNHKLHSEDRVVLGQT